MSIEIATGASVLQFWKFCFLLESNVFSIAAGVVLWQKKEDGMGVQYNTAAKPRDYLKN